MTTTKTQTAAASSSPDLQWIFKKIKNEQELTTSEVEALIYEVECDNPSLFKILCALHAVLDIGSQSNIDSLAENIKQWADKERIRLDY